MDDVHDPVRLFRIWRRGALEFLEPPRQNRFQKTPWPIKEATGFFVNHKTNNHKGNTVNVERPTRVTIEFAEETRFEVPLKKGGLPLPFVEARFGQYKRRLVGRLVRQYREAEIRRRLRHAVLEAEALAWATPYPLLVMQELAEEKVRTARCHARRQTRIRARSEAILTEVE